MNACRIRGIKKVDFLHCLLEGGGDQGLMAGALVGAGGRVCQRKIIRPELNCAVGLGVGAMGLRLTGSKREAVLMCYLIAGACGMVAIFITTASVLLGYAVGLATLVLGAVGIWWFEAKVGHD